MKRDPLVHARQMIELGVLARSIHCASTVDERCMFVDPLGDEFKPSALLEKMAADGSTFTRR